MDEDTIAYNLGRDAYLSGLARTVEEAKAKNPYNGLGPREEHRRFVSWNKGWKAAHYKATTDHKALLKGFKASVARQTVGHGETVNVINVISDAVQPWTGAGVHEVAEALQFVIDQYLKEGADVHR